MASRAQTKDRGRWGLVASALAIALLASSGCMSAADESMAAGDFSNNASPENDVEREDLQLAQTRLFQNDIAGANSVYEGIQANSSQAAAGAAVTRVLLLPYSGSLNGALTCCLGATRSLSVADDIIYSDDGLLYYLSLGVPFEDAEGYPGIITLLEDRMPWPRERIEEPDAFFGELRGDVNTLVDALQPLATELEDIEVLLDRAMANPEFESFFLPGEVFHDEDLSLVLGRTELSAISAVTSTLRTGIHFVGAYDFSWSLADAFGPQWNAITPEDPAYQEGWEAWDYSVDFLSGVLFRAIREPGRLIQARNAASSAIDGLRGSFRYGLEGAPSELGWTDVNTTVAREIDEVLAAIQSALTEETTLPYTMPSTTLNLSSFFEPGRTLDEETPWMERVVVTDEFGDFIEWQLTDAAVDAALVDGVFDPAFDPDSPPEMQFSGDTDEFQSTLVGDLQSDVEDAYLSGR